MTSHEDDEREVLRALAHADRAGYDTRRAESIVRSLRELREELDSARALLRKPRESPVVIPPPRRPESRLSLVTNCALSVLSALLGVAFFLGLIVVCVMQLLASMGWRWG